ncbi:tRNA nucleotidyltransferase (CCA-adding enzyme) [Evansella vedderi]|uniref:tRNA nucleotidyltransferase (CCA-adding enzyme) n=1 Tax=Evansella vedderi TaxID=38282 RepID=A0ABU0A1T2_9BACI|nr:CCA tRNA nucleotidyltransferase [Evansella vedderi]MDQ0257447.1 tRNA nucleotidyltransferase (CCA-adding enzyme) [Evansella vedderi]
MLTWEESAKTVLRKLQDNQYEAYIVGGAVRDKLMKRSIRDVDICTNASVEDLQRIFPRTVDVGVQHGTIIIPIEGKSIEVTQYRNRDRSKLPTLHSDLAMRDFTCNAMAMNINGDLIDPFHGQEAIKNRQLQVVTNSPAPFKEDPLRLLRGVRFSLQLSFSLEKSTKEWMKEYAPLICQPAVERIANELEKIANVILRKRDIQFLLDCKVIRELPYIFPNRDLFQNKLKAMEDTFSISGIMELWSMLSFSQFPEESQRAVNHYKLPRQLKKDILTIIYFVHLSLRKEWTNFALYQLGKVRITSAEKLLALLQGRKLKVEEMISQFDSLPIKSKKEMAVSGKDIMEWYPNKQGEWVGNSLALVEKAIVLNHLPNQKQEIYHWLTKEHKE